jgi:hypothetical protein
MDIHMWMTLDQLYWLAKPFKEEPYTTFSIDYEIKVAEHFFNSNPEKYSLMFLPFGQENIITEGNKVRKELLEIRKRIIKEMNELDIDDIFLEVRFNTELLMYPVY